MSEGLGKVLSENTEQGEEEMKTGLAKLISVAEAASNISIQEEGVQQWFAPTDLPQFCEEDRIHITLHSPANMLKYHKAVEEKDGEVDKAVKLITTACGKKCRCTERVSPCPHCDSIMEGELLYSHALQNFNQALKELTK